MTVQYQGVWSLQSAAQLQSTQRWVTDPLFENTTLLLQADDAANGAQNNTFVDSSSNAFAITRNGNTTQGSFTPFSLQPGAWSTYFSGDNIVTPSNSAFDPSGQNVTVDFFIYLTRYPQSNNVVFEVGVSTVGDLQCNILNTGDVRFTTGGNAGSSISGFTLNTWHYVTCVKSGNNLTVYLNLVAGPTVSLTANSRTTMYIGSQSGGNNIEGYISNFRYVRGSANIPTAIPIAPLTAISNTSLLTFQNNRFLDNSGNSFALTINNDPAVQPFSPFAPQFQWTPSVIGGSGYFDGSGDYLSNSSDIIIPNTGDFTAQFWIYPTQVSSLQYLIATTNNTGNKFYLYINSSAYVGVQTGASYRDSSTTKVVANAWNHIACTRTGSTYALFVNGVSQSISGSGTMASTLDVTPTYIAARDAGNGAVSGYLGSSRITTVVETISIPTAPYTSDANTRLLLNFTNAGIFDGTMKNNLETVGNAQVSTAVVKYGSGSLAFDGNGDYLSLPVQRTIELGSSDWTFETWVYMNAVSSQQSIIYLNGNTTGYAALSLQVQSGALNLWLSSTGGAWSLQQNTIGTIAVNAWNHIAVVKVGTNIKVYINGTNVSGNGYTVAASLMTTYTLNQIGVYNGNSHLLNGYLDDMRLTLGIARYTQNFIPPSVALPRQ